MCFSMENLTNSSLPTSVSELAGPGFGAFIIIITLLLLMSVVLIAITITALCMAHSVPRIVRIFLINLLVAGLFAAGVLMIFTLIGTVLNFTSAPPPHNVFCRLLVWAYIASATTRLHSLPAFSIVILLMVKYNKKDFAVCYIVSALVFLWTAGRILDFNLLVPSFYSVQYYDNVICFPVTNDPAVILEASLAFVGFWVVFGGVVPMTISIVVPIVVLCYVKCNTFTEGSTYNKGLAKFALFLASGNIIHILGHVLVTLVSVNYSEVPSIYISYSFAAASLVPTPIMVVMYLKPVRSVLKNSLCCKQHNRVNVISDHT